MVSQLAERRGASHAEQHTWTNGSSSWALFPFALIGIAGLMIVAVSNLVGGRSRVRSLHETTAFTVLTPSGQSVLSVSRTLYVETVYRALACDHDYHK